MKLERKITASLRLETKSEDVATNIVSIAQGSIALTKLQKEKADAVKLAEAVSLKHDGPNVVATLNLSSDQVIEMLKGDAAKKAKKDHKD